LQEISNYINYRFSGYSVAQILDDVRRAGEGGEDRSEPGFDALVARAVRGLLARGAGGEVVIAGTRYLLDSSDFTDGRRLGFAVAALEDRARLLEVLKRAVLDDETGVIMGGESELTQPGELGMVASVFHHDGRRVGAVGVVGPRRMDYFTIVPTIEYLSQVLTKMLDGGTENSRESAGAL
ncbi:MAG TPA: hypothetical protein ENK19_00685, partial [Acidobacteria bacterium]|nr:hypothetical protein [Acidobacteriota bacterium]